MNSRSSSEGHGRFAPGPEASSRHGWSGAPGVGHRLPSAVGSWHRTPCPPSSRRAAEPPAKQALGCSDQGHWTPFTGPLGSQPCGPDRFRVPVAWLLRDDDGVDDSALRAADHARHTPQPSTIGGRQPRHTHLLSTSVPPCDSEGRGSYINEKYRRPRRPGRRTYLRVTPRHPFPLASVSVARSSRVKPPLA